MTTRPIPFVDLKAAYEEAQTEIDAAIARTVGHSDFVLGDSLFLFEEEFATYCGTRHAIGCANGTDALELVLEAAGIGPGDEVVAPSHTFAATIEAIVRVGACAVLVDVDPDTLLIDVESARAAIGPRTAAIVMVHLYGSCTDPTPFRALARSHNLLLVEDAAQAHGARHGAKRAGSIGDAATFSFYPSKNLGAFGDGGAVVTSDGALNDRIRLLRDHGKSDKHIHTEVGRNSRLDGLQAAILSAKLPRLDEDNLRRRGASELYAQLIKEQLPAVRTVSVPVSCEPVHHLFVVEIEGRDRSLSALGERGIGAGIHYPVPGHRQPAFRASDQVRCDHDLEVTDAACDRVLSLPMFPSLRPAQQEHVIATLQETLSF